MMEDSSQVAVSVSNYKETEYEDASFEIVGTPPSEQTFVPMQMAMIERTQRESDPMFFDFGGKRDSSSSLWHLPETVKYVSEDTKKNEEVKKAQEENQLLSQLDNARAEGMQAGLEQARQELQQEFDQKLALIESKMTTLINDMQQQISEQIVQIEKSAVQFAVDLAEKIIPHAVEINPEYIVPIIEEALNLCGGAIIKRVRVSPDDLEFINVVGLSKNIKQFDGNWEFTADETIRAGCVIDTSAGEVEYDLSKAWERTKNSIVSVLK